MAAYFLSLPVCIYGPTLIFSIPITLPSSLFTGALLFPLITAGVYGERMRQGIYLPAFQRSFFWNLLLFSLGGVSFISGDRSVSYLQWISALALPIGVIVWFLDPFFLGKELRASFENFHKTQWLRLIFNPALLLFLQLILDQKTLAFFGLPQLTLFFYFVSRIFSFFGSILFAYLTSHALENSGFPKSWRWLWCLNCFFCVLILCSSWARDLAAALIWGQWIGWCVSASLLLLVEKKKKYFEGIYLLWFFLLAARWFVGNEIASATYAYSLLLFTSSISALMLLFCFPEYKGFLLKR